MKIKLLAVLIIFLSSLLHAITILEKDQEVANNGNNEFLVYKVFEAINSENEDKTETISLPVEEYVQDVLVCKGDFIQENKVGSYKCDESLNFSFNKNKHLVNINVSVKANSSLKFTLIEKTKMIKDVVAVLRAKKYKGNYYNYLYISNPYNESIKGDLYIPLEILPGDKLYFYIKEGDSLVPVLDVEKIAIKKNGKIRYYYKIPLCDRKNGICVKDSLTKGLQEFYIQSPIILPFNREYLINIVNSPLQGDILIKRAVPSFVSEEEIYKINNAYYPEIKDTDNIQIEDDNVQKIVTTTFPVKKTVNLVSIFKEGTVKEEGYFWWKIVGLDFIKKSLSELEDYCNINVSSSNIESKSGFVYVYKGNFSDLNETKCYMIWADTQTSDEYDTLYYNPKGDKFEDNISVGENQKGVNKYLDREGDTFYAYRLQDTPNAEKDKITLNFSRVPKELSEEGDPLVIINPTIPLKDHDDYLIVINKKGEVYYNLSVKHDDYDFLDKTPSLLTLSPSTLLNINDFLMLSYKNASYDKKEILFSLVIPKYGSKVYLGDFIYFENGKYKIKNFMYIPSKDTLYLLNKDILDIKEDYLVPIYKLNNNKLYTFLNDLVTYIHVSGGTNSFTISISNNNENMLIYNSDYGTSVVVEQKNLTYYDILSNKDVVEYFKKYIITVPSIIEEVLPKKGDYALCYLDGKLVIPNKIGNSFLVREVVKEGVHELRCFLYKNTNQTVMVEQRQEGNEFTQIYYIKVDKPKNVRLAFPIRVNEIPEKVCLNERVDSSCDIEINKDNLQYLPKKTYIEAYIIQKLNRPYYFKIVIKKINDVVDYKITKKNKIVKDKVISRYNIYIKNKRDLIIPYYLLTFNLKYKASTILEIRNGELKDVTDKVRIIKDGNRYRYYFVFSDYLNNVLQGLKPNDERIYTLSMDVDNISVKYIKGNVDGGTYEDGIYTIEKEIVNNRDDTVDLEVYFDEENPSLMKSFITYVYDNNTYFKVNNEKTLDYILVNTILEGKKSKIVGLKYVKDETHIADLEDKIYTDLGVIFPGNFRDKVDEFAKTLEEDNEYLYKGKLYIYHITKKLDEIKNITLKSKKPNEIGVDERIKNIGLVEDPGWDIILQSKDYLFYEEDKETIEDLEEDVIKLIDEFLDYKERVGTLSEALSKIKDCLETHEEDREFCYNKYELSPYEIQKIESCLKETNDKEYCVDLLKEKTNNTTSPVIKEEKPDDTEKLKDLAKQKIIEVQNKITQLLLKKDQLKDEDVVSLNNIQEILNNLNNQLKTSNLSKTELEGLLEQLDNIIEQLNKIKPDPLYQKKKELKEKAQKLLSELRSKRDTFFSNFPEDKLLDITDENIISRYNNLKSRINEILSKVEEIKNSYKDVKDEEEIKDKEQELNDLKEEFNKIIDQLEELKNKILSESNKPKTPTPSTTQQSHPQDVQSSEPEENQEESNLPVFIFIVPAVILLAALGGGIYFYFKKKKLKVSKEEETNDEKTHNEEENKNKEEENKGKEEEKQQQINELVVDLKEEKEEKVEEVLPKIEDTTKIEEKEETNKEVSKEPKITMKEEETSKNKEDKIEDKKRGILQKIKEELEKL